MSEAMQMIVNGYVRVGGRKNLEDLRAHRDRLLSELRSLNRAVDPTSMIRLLEREIEIIDDGLAKLSTTGSVVSIGIR